VRVTPTTTHPQPSHLDATSYPLVAQLLNRLDRAGPPHDIKARPASVRLLIRPADWHWGQQPKINSSDDRGLAVSGGAADRNNAPHVA
jgi:hypothetical protein